MKKHLPITVTLLGAAVLVAGVSLIYVPAGMILAGLAMAAFGLFGIDDGKAE